MAEQANEEIKTDETTKLLNNETSLSNYSHPKLILKRSNINFPSRSLTKLFTSRIDLNESFENGWNKIKFSAQYKTVILCTKLLITLFTVLFFITIFGIICYFIPILDLLVSFTTLISLSCIGSLCGMKLIYSWSFIQEKTLNDLKKTAQEMEKERENLSNSKLDLSQQVINLQQSLSKLGYYANDLEKELSSYQELKIALQERAKESSSIDEMLQEFLFIIEGMEFLKKENAKAFVLRKYYDAAFRDENIGLTKKEYIHFLGKLDNETREIFKQFGGFEKYDKNDNGIIEINEFIWMLESIMQQMEEIEIQSFI